MTVVRRFSESYAYDNIPSVTCWQALNADAFCCKKAQYIRTNFRPVVPGPGTFCDTPTPSSLQSCEKAFGAGIVVRIPFSAHTAFQIVLFQIFQICFATVLAAPIAVKQDFVSRSAL